MREVRKYNRQILSDELYALGKELGRSPTPKDLKPEMARKETYLRWFGDWETALEYAWCDELAQDKEHVDTGQKVVTITQENNVCPYELVNLYGDVVFVGNNGETRVCRADRIARVIYGNTIYARAQYFLREITLGTRICASERECKIVVIGKDGVRGDFPEPTPRIYLLVSRRTAVAAHAIGRSTNDLIYPTYIEHDIENGGLVIRELGMLSNRTLWRL